MNLICSWSGGKDSCFALMQMNQQPAILLNALNENGQISRSHGLHTSILQAQAKAMNVPIDFISATWADYTENFIQKLQQLTQEYQLTDAVFGDIDIEPHREWEENVCQSASLNCHLPLWQQDRKDLVFSMIDSGIVAMIVSCNDHLGQDFLGKVINSETIAELEIKEVDVCGENGEFHTVVLDCPLFARPIDVILGEKRSNRTGYNFLELMIK
jgi:diphthine-ammonia ligase